MRTKKKMLIVGGVLITLSTALLVAVYFYYSRHVEKSPLYLAMSSYQEDAQDWERPEAAAFAENSGEEIFLRGMDAFAGKDYTTAKTLFEQALGAPGGDPALPAYLYFYINQCGYRLNGTGDPETVSLALEAMRQYTPLANDTGILWDLVSSISLSVESDAQAIALMEEHLEAAGDLDLATWAWLKNYIAMLEYNNEEYAKSIRKFYDVELALANVEMTPELEIEQRYAKEYIANIHFIFEDYEKAAALYQELISNASAEGDFHAYGCCINMASAYLDLHDTEKAREAMEFLEEQVPRIDRAIVSEVEASMNDVLANICIQEGNYDEADIWLDKAEAYYQGNTGNAGNAFLGGEYFIMLTRCKYMFRMGTMEEAQRILEDMVSAGDAAYYGIEKDVYELLRDLYQATGQNEKLAAVYQKLLDLDVEFARTTQREYLEFSEYYRENNQLKERNTALSHTNVITTLVILIISLILIAVLVMVRLLRTKNVTDQLTGVFNRKKLTQLMRTYQRSGTPANLGVVMMDIDYFKRYNDTYGHPAGDQVLRETAKVLLSSVRSKDLVIRYGGEEFLVLLNEVQAQTAEAVCQRIHEQLRKRAIPHAASEASEYITLSMGLCHQASPNIAPLEKLIEYADECLYQSKEAGRNRATIKALP